MNIELNNSPYQLEEGTTLALLAKQLNLANQGVAMAINYEVISRNLWEDTIIKEGDQLMVIKAVSGG